MNKDIVNHHPLRPDCKDGYILDNGGKECDILWLKPNDESDDGLIWDGNYDVCHLKVIKEGVGVVPAFYFEGNFENQNPNNEKEEFTVTFFDRGREISTQTVRKGECAVFTKPEPNYYFSDVIRCRFDFVGWKTSDNAIFDFSTPIISDTFLEAYYEPVDLSSCKPVSARITGYDEQSGHLSAELCYEPMEVNTYFPLETRYFGFLVFDSENNIYDFRFCSLYKVDVSFDANKYSYDGYFFDSLPGGQYRICLSAGKEIIYTIDGEPVSVSSAQIESGILPENCFYTITIRDYLLDTIWGKIDGYNNDAKKVFAKVRNLTSDSLPELNVGFIIFDSKNESYSFSANFNGIDEVGNSIFECDVGSLPGGQYKVCLTVNNRIIYNGTTISIALEQIEFVGLTENCFYPITIDNNTIITLGTWPQTIKSEAVTITDETKVVGMFTYYKGSDGEWYAKTAENAYGSNYTYSNGATVGQGGTSEKYFKVLPIKWRVLTDNYSGKKLLLADSILVNCAYYDYKYKNVNRTINETTVYPNNYEHSRIRAYLNGLSYQVKSDADPETEQVENTEFYATGFLQTAFSSSEIEQIATVTVDNSARSINPDANETLWYGYRYVCSNTEDKIFLLSEQEVTTESYGFDVYNAYGIGNTRIRVTTDFAKACGTDMYTSGYGSYWWLRSPYTLGDCALGVHHNGGAGDGVNGIGDSSGGVVPALCLED